MKNCVGIRREDKNLWEKRAPLIPSHVQELVREKGIEFRIQPSTRRVFSDSDYAQAGAIITEDLSSCRLILAIKEIPAPLIERDKVYMFFSHTIKGQIKNMPMLRRLAEQRSTLIEYERIVDDRNRRLIFFGTQAGQAGMIEVLHALGRRLALEGIDTPFREIQQPFKYGSLVAARESIEEIGLWIRKDGIDRRILPLICGFAGYGNTSRGAQGIFDLLPVESIEPADLGDFMKRKNYSASRVYKTVFKEADMVRPLNPSASFELKDYYQHPEKYRSIFSDYLPHLTMLVNGIYWEPRYPRFVPTSALQSLFESQPQPRLRVIGDISCDIDGSIECNRFATTPDKPVFLCDPLTGQISDNPSGRGVVIMSIDNLPAEIPRESSMFFSKALMPFLPDIATADLSGAFESWALPSPIKRAVVLDRGKLRPEYSHLAKFLQGIS